MARPGRTFILSPAVTGLTTAARRFFTASFNCCALHPFRFGVQYGKPESPQAFRETARKVEDLGYSSLFCHDHFWDSWSAIVHPVVAAEVTTTLRVGTLVYAADYRHPAVLAKDFATLDLVAEGRTEFGIGAGWLTDDYEQAGIALERPGIRIDRMIEALEVIQGLWRGESFSYHGEHYQISGMVGRPLPHTPGGPPVIIGGGGKRVLTEAARRADIIGLNPNLRSGTVGTDAARSSVAAEFALRRQWIADAAGDRLADIEIQLNTFMALVTENADSVFAEFAPEFGLTPQEAQEVPLVLAGTVDDICEQLHHHREAYGASYIIIHDPEVTAMAPVVARLAGT